MKKVFIIVLFIISFQLNCFAKEAIGIKFIYLNGSNANTEKKRQDFIKGIYDVQRAIKDAFEQSPCIKKTLLKDGLYNIDAIPCVCFWGFDSKVDLKETEALLQKTKKSSTFLASHFRDSIVHNIHDIIWIERRNNMRKTIDKLHQCVLNAENNGQKVVLLGHSAGAFITYVYVLNKTKDFCTEFLLPEEENKMTCADAITASGFGVRLYDGSFVKNPNQEMMVKGYNELDEFTKTECISDGLILGVMNFGSPQPLFYPDRLNEPKNNEYVYQKNFLSYLKYSDLFYLTLNYKEDVLTLLPKYNIPAKANGRGFMYTYMKKKSLASFIKAHYTYWKYPKQFAKMAKEGYLEGLSQK